MAQAEQGRRVVVQDPLRQSAQQVLPERSVPLTGVRGPANPSMQGFAQQRSEFESAWGSLEGAMQGVFEKNKDEWITKGKEAFLSGVTEEELMKSGNRFTQMGYLQLSAKADVDEWYLRNSVDIQTAYNSMAPDEFQQYLEGQRKDYLDGVTDPYARRVAVSAFEQYSPQLAKDQLLANNAYNQQQQEIEYGRSLESGSFANPDASRLDDKTALRLSDTQVAPTYMLTPSDRDAMIRTLIGEAGNQGDTGMAAVAHVIFNRASDTRFPNSALGVVKQKNQFSVWNPGREGASSYLNRLSTKSKTYQRAANIVDAVASGRHVDPTGGALYYYSPSGMKAYKAKGIQSHLVPSWAREQEAENLVVIGGHRFSGKTNGAQYAEERPAQEASPGIDTQPRGDEFLPVTPGIDQNPDLQHGVGAEDLPGNALFNGKPLNETMQENTAAVEGVVGIQSRGQNSEVIDQILSTPMDKQRNAAIVADTMIRQLAAGNDQLYNDAGGLSIFSKLGADPAVAEKVRKAHESYTKNKHSEYDLADQKFEDEILRGAADGSLSLEDIDKRIKERIAAEEMSDAQAVSIVDRVLTERRAADKQAAANSKADQDKLLGAYNDPQFRMSVGRLTQGILAGDIPQVTAYEQAADLALEYNLNGTEVTKLITEVAAKIESRENTLRTKAEAATKAQAESAQLKSEAEGALARGYGLEGLSGQIKEVQPDGTIKSTDVKTWAIEKIRTGVLAKYEGQDPNTAQPAIAREFFSQLQKQGLVDPKTQAQINGALRGELIVAKDGKIRPDALSAYNMYTIMKQDTTISDAYIAKVVNDPTVLAMLEEAWVMDSGNLSAGDALVRAHEAVRAKSDTPPAPSAGLDKVITSREDEIVTELMADFTDAGFLSTALGIDQPEQARQALEWGKPELTRRLREGAARNKAMYPFMSDEAAYNMAKNKVLDGATVVAGNLVWSKVPVSKMMGVDNPQQANEAVNWYLSEYGNELWPYEGNEHWYDKVLLSVVSPLGSVANELGAFDDTSEIPGMKDQYDPGFGYWKSYSLGVGLLAPGGGKRLIRELNKQPPVHISVIPSSAGNGMIRIQRVLENGELDYARPVVVSLSAIGTEWKNQEIEPNMFEKLFDKGVDALGANARRVQDVDPAQFSTKTKQIPDMGAQ